MNQGTVSFPGIKQVVSATMSLTHGTSPSVCSIEILPQKKRLALVGRLTFQFGHTRFSFQDCKIAEGSIRWNRQGTLWQLAIYDRRWKWRYGTISGHYNLHRHKDTPGAFADSSQEAEIENIIQWTKKSAIELAALCLTAMGESAFDCHWLPANVYPEVHWEDVPPAEALAQLCDTLGYIIVLNLNNRVVIYKKGVGSQLPNDPILSGGSTIDPPEGPDEIEIVCGPTLYQKDWPLEAVGINSDISNTIVPIAELDYMPTGGWSGQYWESFDDVTTAGNHGGLNQNLARQSVWRMYRLVTPTVGGGNQPITHRQQILPIGTEQVFLHVDNGTVQNVPAAAYGTYFQLFDDCNNSAANTRYYRSFSIDANLGVVIFADPVFFKSSGGDVMDATMKLRTTLPYRDANTLAWERYRYVKKVPKHEHVVKKVKLSVVHDELQLYYNEGKTINEKEVKAACEFYAKAILDTYNIDFPATASYGGLLNVSLDGAINNVTWIVGTSGATTTVSRNTEQFRYVKPYYMRRNEQKAVENAKVLERSIRGAWKSWGSSVAGAIGTAWNWRPK